mmetsp:Transcript_63356/g.182329  ORF Transcript_63356/g.182329 Transcript_63356/m.182329 type:complete len:247 (+) Transcript_63356:232-972(+)
MWNHMAAGYRKRFSQVLLPLRWTTFVGMGSILSCRRSALCSNSPSTLEESSREDFRRRLAASVGAHQRTHPGLQVAHMAARVLRGNALREQLRQVEHERAPAFGIGPAAIAHTKAAPGAAGVVHLCAHMVEYGADGHPDDGVVRPGHSEDWDLPCYLVVGLSEDRVPDDWRSEGVRPGHCVSTTKQVEDRKRCLRSAEAMAGHPHWRRLAATDFLQECSDLARHCVVARLVAAPDTAPPAIRVATS